MVEAARIDFATRTRDQTFAMLYDLMSYFRTQKPTIHGTAFIDFRQFDSPPGPLYFLISFISFVPVCHFSERFCVSFSSLVLVFGIQPAGLAYRP